MISRLAGTLASRGIDRIEIMTSGGVGYEVVIPLGVLESLPREGGDVSLHTALVVKDPGSGVFAVTNQPSDLSIGMPTVHIERPVLDVIGISLR